MPSYVVVLSTNAKKQLDKLSDPIAKPILDSINELSINPRPIGCIKLRGREGYRIRCGNFRIIYEIIDKELLIDVLTIGNRKDVYK